MCLLVLTWTYLSSDGAEHDMHTNPSIFEFLGGGAFYVAKALLV